MTHSDRELRESVADLPEGILIPRRARMLPEYGDEEIVVLATRDTDDTVEDIGPDPVIEASWLLTRCFEAAEIWLLHLILKVGPCPVYFEVAMNLSNDAYFEHFEKFSRQSLMHLMVVGPTRDTNIVASIESLQLQLSYILSDFESRNLSWSHTDFMRALGYLHAATSGPSDLYGLSLRHGSYIEIHNDGRIEENSSGLQTMPPMVASRPRKWISLKPQ